MAKTLVKIVLQVEKLMDGDEISVLRSPALHLLKGGAKLTALNQTTGKTATIDFTGTIALSNSQLTKFKNHVDCLEETRILDQLEIELSQKQKELNEARLALEARRKQSLPSSRDSSPERSVKKQGDLSNSFSSASSEVVKPSGRCNVLSQKVNQPPPELPRFPDYQGTAQFVLCRKRNLFYDAKTHEYCESEICNSPNTTVGIAQTLYRGATTSAPLQDGSTFLNRLFNVKPKDVDALKSIAIQLMNTGRILLIGALRHYINFVWSESVYEQKMIWEQLHLKIKFSTAANWMTAYRHAMKYPLAAMLLERGLVGKSGTLLVQMIAKLAKNDELMGLFHVNKSGALYGQFQYQLPENLVEVIDCK